MMVNDLTVKGIDDNRYRNSEILKNIFCFDLYIVFNASAYS